MPLEHQHDPVALLDAQSREVVGAAVGAVHHVGKGEPSVAQVIAHVLHGQGVGLFLPHGVYQVEGEVELVGIPELNVGGRAVFVFGYGDEPAVDPFCLGFADPLGRLGRFHTGNGEFFHGCAGGVQNDGIEDTLLPFHGDHPMGGGGVIVDGVPGVEDLLVFPDLDLQGPFDDDVEFLPFVGGQLDVLPGGLFVIFHFHVQRFGDTVLEGGGHVVVGHPVGVVDLLPFALSGDGVSGQRGGLPFDDVGDVYAQRQRASVNERKVQIVQTRFAGDVFRFGDAGFGCHIGRGVSFNFPQFPDSCGHFLDLELQPGNLCLHRCVPFLCCFFEKGCFYKQKSSSQRISRFYGSFFETNLRNII